MKIIENLQRNFAKFLVTITRFPLTTIFLILLAIVNFIQINEPFEKYSVYALTLVVGTMISIVSRQLFERYFTKQSERLFLLLCTIIFTILYYFTMGSSSVLNTEQIVKTAVVVFALTMSFIWIPTIKSKLTFNESFLATFKAFFITVLFSIVVSSGVNAIILAIDNLLISLDFIIYSHAMNIIVSLFSPILFLSFIPRYLGERDKLSSKKDLEEREAFIKKATSSPKYLVNLISYVVIPLVVVYTIILLIYITLNITDNFWTKNLMEPLLVSYSIAVIIVYILASNLENKFSNAFRKIFPKVLVVIVSFQTISSVLKISNMGITHGRYYVIMFGVFALLSGLIFSFLSIKKNGYIVIILLIFSLISIVPPVDAFTVSKENQTNKLKEILIENDMFVNGKIVPNENLSTKNKVFITRTINYLQTMGYIDDIDWLPSNVILFDQFNKTFGFNEMFDVDEGDREVNKYLSFNINESPAIDISKYDFMTSLYLYTGSFTSLNVPVKTNNGMYKLTQELEDGNLAIKLIANNDKEIINYEITKVIESLFLNENYDTMANGLTVEQATFTTENERAILTLLINSINVYGDNYDLDVYIFIKIK